MLSQQPSGLPRRWYFPNPVGNVARVVEDLEVRIILVSLEQFLPSGQYGKGVAAVADDQIAREAVIYTPAGLGEPLPYLFGGLHALSPSPRS